MFEVAWLDFRYAVALATGLVGAYTDYRTRLIPNILTYPAVGFGLLLPLIALGWEGLSGALAGAAVAGGPLLFAFLLRKAGGGDVKMMAALGALFGFPKALDLLALSLVFALLYVLAVQIRAIGVWAVGAGGARTAMIVSKLLFMGLPDQAVVRLDHDAPKFTVPFGTAAGAACILMIASALWQKSW